MATLREIERRRRPLVLKHTRAAAEARALRTPDDFTKDMAVIRGKTSKEALDSVISTINSSLSRYERPHTDPVEPVVVKPRSGTLYRAPKSRKR